MAEPVRVRRPTDDEDRRLQRLVRRGEGKGQASVVPYRRAMVVLASAGGNTVPVIAGKWAGGRPPRITLDPERDAKLDRTEQLLTEHPDRCFAFDEFGLLAIHPIAGCCWAAEKRPRRLPANYHTAGCGSSMPCSRHSRPRLAWKWAR